MLFGRSELTVQPDAHDVEVGTATPVKHEGVIALSVRFQKAIEAALAAPLADRVCPRTRSVPYSRQGCESGRRSDGGDALRNNDAALSLPPAFLHSDLNFLRCSPCKPFL